MRGAVLHSPFSDSERGREARTGCGQKGPKMNLTLEQWWVGWAEMVLSWDWDTPPEMWYQAAAILAADRGPA